MSLVSLAIAEAACSWHSIYDLWQKSSSTEISNSVTILGPGVVELDGDMKSRIFNISKPQANKITQGRKIELRYSDPETKKEVRISTGTLDECEALEQKKQLEAKLLLGIDAKPKKRHGGPLMDWQEFRERYRALQLSTLRADSIEAVEVRLNVAERILKPKTLADMARADSLHDLRAKLLEGAENMVGPKDERRSRGPRSLHTVKSYMVAVMTALNWTKDMEWMPAVPKVRKV
jgi:hypothetical protein